MHWMWSPIKSVIVVFVLGLAAQTAAAQTNSPNDELQTVHALALELVRQTKPYWLAPDGPDSEKLVTIVTFELEPNGSLTGPPTVARQEGITDANRELAVEHAAKAIEAVTRAAPFRLPSRDYELWRKVTLNFDKRAE